MAYFQLKQSTCHLTLTAGLMLLRQCFLVAELDLLDVHWPKRGKIRWSDLVKAYVGLLSLGMSDSEATEAFRRDRFFQEALGIGRVPESVWLRQSLEANAAVLRDTHGRLACPADPAQRCADDGYACVDFDTFVMDNSGTQKECVGRT